MINSSLKKEILLHSFNKLGVFLPKNKVFDLVENLLDKRFLLEQTLKFETETGDYSNSIWAGSTKIEGGTVKIIVANLTEEIPEYVAIIQLDAFPPYALRMSLDKEDSGTLAFMIEDKWIETSTLFQAKFLVALEGLSEIITPWAQLTEYTGIYKILIDFLKHDNEGE